MPRTWKDVAESVTERRKALMLTQAQAAAASNVSATTWQKLEVRHEAPSERSLRKMARVLKWPPDFAETLLAGRIPEAPPIIDFTRPGDIAPGQEILDPTTRLRVRVEELERIAPGTIRRRHEDGAGVVRVGGLGGGGPVG